MTIPALQDLCLTAYRTLERRERQSSLDYFELGKLCSPLRQKLKESGKGRWGEWLECQKLCRMTVWRAIDLYEKAVAKWDEAAARDCLSEMRIGEAKKHLGTTDKDPDEPVQTATPVRSRQKPVMKPASKKTPATMKESNAEASPASGDIKIAPEPGEDESEDDEDEQREEEEATKYVGGLRCECGTSASEFVLAIPIEPVLRKAPSEDCQLLCLNCKRQQGAISKYLWIEPGEVCIIAKSLAQNREK